MRADWFADLVSPVVPGTSPVTGDAGNRSAMRASPMFPVVPDTEQETGHDERDVDPDREKVAA